MSAHAILATIEAIAFAMSGGFWLISARIPVPIIEATYDQIAQIKELTENLAAASKWSRWAALAASAGAIVYVVGMIL